MSYRRTNKRAEMLWRKSHREKLLAAGLPESVVDNEKNWIYLLLHRNDEFQSGWNPSWINHKQAQELLDLLRRQTFWSESAHDMFAALQRKVSEDGSAQTRVTTRLVGASLRARREARLDARTPRAP